MSNNDRNNAHAKAARELQARNPGMPYTRARNIAGQRHGSAPIAKLAKEFGTLVGQWELRLAEQDDHLEQLAAAPQPQTNPYVTARVDHDGLLTTLSIDDEAVTKYSPEELGQVVTGTLQTVFDDVDAKVREVYGDELREPDRAAEPRIVIKGSDPSGITVAVDRWLRPLYCEIQPPATAQGAEILAMRISGACRAAQGRVVQQIRDLTVHDIPAWLADDGTPSPREMTTAIVSVEIQTGTP